MPKLPHISFSSFKLYNQCPNLWKLTYVDKVEAWKDNCFMIFGTCIHSVVQDKLKFNLDKDYNAEFQVKFSAMIKEKLKPEEIEEYKDLIEEMKDQGKGIIDEIKETLTKEFGNFEVLAIEEDLLEPFLETSDGRKIKFKGFIDILIKAEDGRLVIGDFKSFSWGWDSHQKSDKMLAYQLVYYKAFLSQKLDIPEEELKNIDTYFMLLKRTVKKEFCEIVPVTSGTKRIQNAKELLEKTVKNIEHDSFKKNRKSCDKCKFHKTSYCKNSFGF